MPTRPPRHTLKRAQATRGTGARREGCPDQATLADKVWAYQRRRAGTSSTAAVGGRSCRPPASPPPLCQPGDHRPPGRVFLEGRFRRTSTSGAVGPDQHSRPPSMPGLLTGFASSATGTKGAPHADRPCNTGQHHRHPDRPAPRPRPRGQRDCHRSASRCPAESGLMMTLTATRFLPDKPHRQPHRWIRSWTAEVPW
jgi:hypothetical protein